MTNLNVIGVIPARYASKRLPFKLLRSLCGKTLLQWTWENASSAGILDKLIIACDHPELEKEAKDFGAEVVMTSVDHSSGTDRIAEAVRDIDVDIVINIQADEPLLHPSVINNLAQEMLSNSNLVMATAKKRIEDKEEIANPNVVKVICDKSNYAVYFSRFPLPFFRNHNTSEVNNVSAAKLPPACCSSEVREADNREILKSDSKEAIYYKHLGVYAYTKDFLYTFKNSPRSYLEQAEKLEQLRAIESGYKIKVIETQFDSLGVDTAEDLKRVENILGEKLKNPK